MIKKQITFLIAIMASFYVNAQSLYFPPVSGSTWDTISPQSLNWCQTKIDSLYDYLDTNNTKAFIVLKDGKIVLEKYFDAHNQNTLWQWASAGKTITSFMVGIAQQEGYLSITDTTSDYLGQGWTICTPAQEEKITIRHQLTMSSGLDDNLQGNTCTLDTCLFYIADAGTRWAYHNAPYTLLGDVINNATGMTLNAYTTDKLKTPTGMTGLFVNIGYLNIFYSNARSMARFGLLMLNNGNWDGNQIMTDTAYFHQMVNTSQTMNPSYGYLWWLNGKSTYMLPETQTVYNGFVNPNAPADLIMAIGAAGQFLNIVPSQNLVFVRMGSTPLGLPEFSYQMNDKIWEYINDLECNANGMSENSNNNNLVQIFPNPSKDGVNIKSDKIISKVEIFNSQGQLIKTVNSQNKEISVSIDGLLSGIYFAKVHTNNGNVWVEKIIKE